MIGVRTRPRRRFSSFEDEGDDEDNWSTLRSVPLGAGCPPFSGRHSGPSFGSGCKHRPYFDFAI
jgi:hypothetical protein